MVMRTALLASAAIIGVAGLGMKPASATSILVAQCVAFTTCFSSGSPTPWTDTLTSAQLTSLGLSTTQPFIAAETSQTVIRLGVTTVAFTTTTGPVTASLPEFSGGIHFVCTGLCEIDTVGTFFIPDNALSATISGTFGNSVVPNSAAVNLCLGSGPGACAAAVPEPASLLLVGAGLIGLGAARRRNAG